jgi:type IV pilus biogenesis protein CpaD/CtpE
MMIVRRLLLVAASLALAGCNGGTVDRHALTKDTEAIDSLACEGRLLAHEVVVGDDTSRFTRVHADELRQRASNFEDALSERPTVAGIEHEVRALARKSGRIAALLGQLHAGPDDGASARRLEQLLANAGDCP